MSPINLTSIFLNNHPGDYFADENLVKAVEVAIALGKPLLISGEPGTGKTQLANFVAWQLARQTQTLPYSFLEKPLIFNTKSSSVSTDLFYYYDAISHFRNKIESVSTSNFIELRALGKAIVSTHGKKTDVLKGLYGIQRFDTIDDAPRSSVVLIDEIDKAPRDFPNDLLNEMENYEFDIKEINQTIRRASNEARIIVIMTSNSEKNLPNAFLRRCVFYHIDFPDKEKLLTIVKQRLAIGDEKYDTAVKRAIEKFMEIRSAAINKKPATSEFLDWMNVLKEFNLLNGHSFPTSSDNPDDYKKYKASMNVLIKSKDDIDKINI